MCCNFKECLKLLAEVFLIPSDSLITECDPKVEITSDIALISLQSGTNLNMDELKQQTILNFGGGGG